MRRTPRQLGVVPKVALEVEVDRKSTRLNSSHSQISYAVFCLKKKTQNNRILPIHHPVHPTLHPALRPTLLLPADLKTVLRQVPVSPAGLDGHLINPSFRTTRT